MTHPKLVDASKYKRTCVHCKKGFRDFTDFWYITWFLLDDASSNGELRWWCGDCYTSEGPDPLSHFMMFTEESYAASKEQEKQYHIYGHCVKNHLKDDEDLKAVLDEAGFEPLDGDRYFRQSA